MRPALHAALRRGDAARCIARFGYAPRVTGRPALPPDANETAWLAARRPLVTASEMAAVLGMSSYDSPFSLWWKKQPDWPHPEQSLQMHIGRKLEAVIGELWSEGHPEAGLWRPGASLWVHPTETWMGATPDYLAVFPHAITPPVSTTTKITGVYVEPVECKSDEGGDGWGKAGTDEVPEHHLVQVIVQCLVLGVPRGRIMRLSGKRTTEYVIAVADHDDLVARIITEGRTFHTTLETGVAPDIDAHEATARTLSDLYPEADPEVEVEISETLHKELRDAKQAVKDAKALETFAVNRLRDLLGRDKAKYATVDGRRVAVRSIYKRQGYVVKPGMVDQVRMLGGKD